MLVSGLGLGSHVDAELQGLIRGHGLGVPRSKGDKSWCPKLGSLLETLEKHELPNCQQNYEGLLR